MRFLPISFIWIVLLVISPICYTYKVLVVSPILINSHIILNRALVNLLLQAGFEVTHITVMRQGKFHPNLKQILISTKDMFAKPQNRNEAKAKESSERFAVQKFSEMLQQPPVNTLLLNTTQTFDLVIAEWLFSAIFSGLAAVYGCPFIWFGTAEPHILMFSLVDKNHVSPVTISEAHEREAFAKVFEPLLAMRDKPLYSYNQLRSVASLVLLNSRGNVDPNLMWPKKFIPLAGFHVDLEVDPLHKTLKRLMDSAKRGFIYLSFGTNIYSVGMYDDIRHDLLKIFADLEQTVLWQQEQEFLYLPSNVHRLKWSSQQKILSHPNCVLFITHGGGLSTTEALHFGVPMIGLPVFGDQITNINNAVAEGVATKVNDSHSIVDDIKSAILDMIKNPSYRRKAKQLSTAYRLRSIKAKRDLIYWVNQTIQFNYSHYEDLGPLFNTYITFKTYMYKDTYHVSTVLAVLIIIPFSFKLLVSLHTKSRNTKVPRK